MKRLQEDTMGRTDLCSRRQLLAIVAAATALPSARAQTGEIKPVTRAAGDWPTKPKRIVRVIRTGAVGQQRKSP